MTDIVRDPYGNPLNRDKLITSLRAENENLRAALESIADLPPGYADMRQDDLVVILANKARAALEKEPSE